MEVVQHDDSGQRDNLCSILDATDQCSLRFGAYVTLDNADNMTLARDLEQRLEIWAYYSGANAREGLSLDDRLKYHDDIKAAILGLLRMVYLQLGQGVSCHRRSLFFSPFSPLQSSTWMFTGLSNILPR